MTTVNVTAHKVTTGAYDLTAECAVCGGIEHAGAVKVQQGYTLHTDDGIVVMPTLRDAKAAFAQLVYKVHNYLP